MNGAARWAGGAAAEAVSYSGVGGWFSGRARAAWGGTVLCQWSARCHQRDGAANGGSQLAARSWQAVLRLSRGRGKKPVKLRGRLGGTSYLVRLLTLFQVPIWH